MSDWRTRITGEMLMQVGTESEKSHSVNGASFADIAAATSQSVFSECKIVRCNVAVASFDPSKISMAMTKAFLAIEGGQDAASARLQLRSSPHFFGVKQGPRCVD